MNRKPVAGILFLLALLVIALIATNGVSAAVYNISNPKTVFTGQAQTVAEGFNLTISCANCTSTSLASLLKVQLSSAITASTVYLFTPNGTGVRASAAVTNGVATFNYVLGTWAAVNNTYLVIAYSSGGAGYTAAFNDTYTYPYTQGAGVTLVFGERCYGSTGANCDTQETSIYGYGITNVVVDDNALPSPVGLVINVSNLVNGTNVWYFCANVSNASYSSVECTTTGLLTLNANRTSPGNTSLTLPLTNATAFNGSATDTSPNSILATLNGKTLNHGTLTNNPSLNSSGKYGNAYNFDGSLTYIAVANNATQNLQSAKTITAWVNSRNISATQFIIAKGFSGTSFEYDIRQSGSKYLFVVTNSTGSTACQAVPTATSSSNTWYHLSAMYNSTHCLLYIDGTLVGTGTKGSLTVVDSTQEFRIGIRGSSTFNGTIDEVRIWNASLSQAEIQAEMNSAYPVRGQNLVASYSFELNNITAGASLNTTADTNYLVNGSTTGEGAYYYDGTNDYLNAGSSSVLNLTSAGTISYWVQWYAQSYANNGRAYDKNGKYMSEIIDSNGRIDCGFSGLSDNYLTGDGTALVSGVWSHVVCMYNGTHMSVWQNGVLKDAEASTGTIDSGTGNLSIGGDAGGTRSLNGSLSNVMVFSRALSASEVLDLYERESFGFGTYSVLAFNVSDLGASRQDYFNVTNSSVGFSQSLTVSLPTYQALLSLGAYQLLTNASITGFNASTGSSSNTTTGTTLFLRANNGTNTVTINVSGNYSKTLTCTVLNTLSTQSCNATGIYDDLYTIGAKTVAGSGLSNFTVNVTNSTLGGTLYSTSTTNGSIVFPLLQGYTYQMIMQATGYAWDNKTLAGNASTQLYNFSVYTTNSFNFTFLYEENRTTITGINITLEMIGELASYNYTTSNGLLYVDLITPETYTLRYGGNNLLTRFYRYTLSNNTFQYLNLTSCTVSTCSNVTINVLDSIGNPLEGAIVKIKKFNLPTNDYPIMEIVETNFEGQAQAGIEVNNEFYIFVIEYEDQVVYTSEKTYVYGDSLTFQVSLRASGFETVFTNQNLQGNVTFSNSTNTGTFRYNDVSNTATQSCLYAYRLTRTGKTLYNSTCSSSSSGTIAVLVLNESGRAYSLEGYMTTGGSTYLVDSVLYTYTAYLPETQRGFGLLIGFIIIVVFIFVVRFSLELAAIVPGVIMLFVSIAQLWTVGVEASVSVLIMGIIVAYFVGFRK